MTSGDQEMDLTPPTSTESPLRMDKLSIGQLWDYLSNNNTQENGDVVVPAKLVQIMSALVISMQETALRMAAMEDQLKKSAESTNRLDKLGKQLTTLIASTQSQSEPRVKPAGLPNKPTTWAAIATANLKVTSDQAPASPPPPIR